MPTASYVWLAAIIIFAIFEAVTAGLVSLWFIGGALCALIAALIGGSSTIQILLFFVVSIALLLALRPLAQRYISPNKLRANADRLLGREVLVTETVDNLHARGTVRVDGVIWTARAPDHTVIEEGTLVRITKIEGSKVYVEPVAVCAAVQ